MKMIKYVIMLLLGTVIISCNKGDKFTVRGVVSGSADGVLYLEHVGIGSVTLLDSVKLNANGAFEFRHKRPAYPDFYHLRLGNQLINFSIDSTEVLELSADAGSFATSYTVSGSLNAAAMKEITLALLEADASYRRLSREYKAGSLSAERYSAESKIGGSLRADRIRQDCRSQLDSVIESYKAVALRYIYANPGSPVSYYALFQQIDGRMIFDIYNKVDSRVFGAVATSYDHWYPDSERAKHLHNLAMQAIKYHRSERVIDLDSLVSEIDFLDIELPDLRGELVKLSEASKNKVTLLSFTAYETEWSSGLNTILSKLYAEYHGSGLEIYQISLDSDLHLWRNIVQDLPWICVRDEESLYAVYAKSYNVTRLPATFIINRKGVLLKRIDDVNNIAREIKWLF